MGRADRTAGARAYSSAQFLAGNRNVTRGKAACSLNIRQSHGVHMISILIETQPSLALPGESGKPEVGGDLRSQEIKGKSLSFKKKGKKTLQGSCRGGPAGKSTCCTSTRT